MAPWQAQLDAGMLRSTIGALSTFSFSGPTCTIPVRDNLTSLDMTVQQIEHLNNTYGTDVPLVLMNSFLTDEDTSKIIRKYSGFKVKIRTFKQSCFPRINKDSLMPFHAHVTQKRISMLGHLLDMAIFIKLLLKVDF